MITKAESVHQLAGTVMDILLKNDDSLNLDELNALGTEIATALYDDLLRQVLPANRAILIDQQGNVVGSVDLTGMANIWMKSELDWRNAVYKALGVTP